MPTNAPRASLLLLATLLLCAAASVRAQSNPSESSRKQTGAAKPAAPSIAATADLRVIDFAGYRKLLEKHRGKPVLVNFWATWCPPCRSEYPVVNEIARAYSSKGLVVIGVNFDDDAEMNLVRRFLARNLPVFPNVRMKMGLHVEFTRGVDSAWSGSIPATILYHRDGRIVARLMGEQSRESFARAVESLLASEGKAAPKAAQH